MVKFIYGRMHKQEEVYIHIKDNGEGIEPAQLIKLGEPYYSTKTKGTGLGLMITFRIIEVDARAY